MLGSAHTGLEMAWGPAGQRSLSVCCQSPPWRTVLGRAGQGQDQSGNHRWLRCICKTDFHF